MKKTDYLYEADRYIIRTHLCDTHCAYYAMELTFREFDMKESLPKFSDLLNNRNGCILGGDVTTGLVQISIPIETLPVEEIDLKGVLNEYLSELCFDDCQFIIVEDVVHREGLLKLTFYCFAFEAAWGYFLGHTRDDYAKYAKKMIQYRRKNLVEHLRRGHLKPLKN